MSKKSLSLPVLPAMPSAKSVRRLSACFCGCGGTTQRLFVPGHDAKLKGWVLRVELGIISLDDLADWPGIQKRVKQVVDLRASGKNVTFMANVELPAKAEATGTE